jgi:preprotein translocase subunit SecB
MSETTADVAEQQTQFDIQKVYCKDISLETPNSPGVFRDDWSPDINVQMNTEASQLAEGIYEVVLMVTVTAKLGESTAFLVEVQQGGIFTIGGMEESELGPVLGSLCPGILFPYAREAVSDLVTRAGFPPLVLSPVNFDALFYQHLMEQQSDEEPTQA